MQYVGELSFPTSPSRKPVLPRMSRYTGMMLAYKVLRMLVTDPEDTHAFSLGIVDKTGKRVRLPKNSEERDAYNHLQRIVFKMQHLIKRAPGGRSRLATWAAALWFVREQAHGELVDCPDSYIIEGIERELRALRREDAAVNAVGGGNVAGVGVGPDGEPGVYRKRRRRVVLGDVLRRRTRAQ